MERDVTNLHDKRIEQSLSKIGAKIADAAELSHKAKELSADSEAILTNVQQELEELYVSLEKQLTEGK